MKRLVILSGACVMLAGAYAVWLKRERRLQTQEQRMKLQTWEAEGGSPGEATSKTNTADVTYS